MMRRAGRIVLSMVVVLVVLVASFVVLYRGIASDPADLRSSNVGTVPPSSGSAVPHASPSATPSAPPTHVARPVRVQIPAIDVDAKLRPVGLREDGSMEVPDFGAAGWYVPGPRPGEPGPAVIVGHVDSYQGPDVFFRLRELSPGDEILVRHRDGTSSRFVVESSEQQLKEQLPVTRIWNDTRQPVLRLVTCGGEFDEEERRYRSNVIIYAAPSA